MKNLQALVVFFMLALASAAQANQTTVDTVPVPCRSDAAQALADGEYVAAFPALIWYEKEPYFKLGEFGGFAPIGSYNLDVPPGTNEGKAGLARVERHTQDDGTPFWRLEFYAPFKGKCEWYGGTVLRREHKDLELLNASGGGVYADPVIGLFVINNGPN